MVLTFRALRVLRWLADNPQASHVPGDVVSEDDSLAVYDELSSARLIAETLTLDGGFDFVLSPSGRVESRNAVDTYRAELVQRRVLEWVREQGSLAGLVGGPLSEDFSGPLTDAEVSDAADELEHAGLLRGQKNANGEFFTVEVSPTGRAALRNPYGFAQQAGGVVGTSSTHISADNYGSMTVGNQVIGGHGNTMNAEVNQGVSMESVLGQIVGLRDAVSAATGVDDVARDDAIGDIDRVLATGANRGLSWIKTELVAVASLLAASINQGLADQALAIGASIIS